MLVGDGDIVDCPLMVKGAVNVSRTKGKGFLSILPIWWMRHLLENAIHRWFGAIISNPGRRHLHPSISHHCHVRSHKMVSRFPSSKHQPVHDMIVGHLPLRCYLDGRRSRMQPGDDYGYSHKPNGIWKSTPRSSTVHKSKKFVKKIGNKPWIPLGLEKLGFIVQEIPLRNHRSLSHNPVFVMAKWTRGTTKPRGFLMLYHGQRLLRNNSI